MKNVFALLVSMLLLITTTTITTVFASSDSNTADANASTRDLEVAAKTPKDKTYSIEIVYLGEVSQAIKDAVGKAKARWESIIISDIPGQAVLPKNTKCAIDEIQLSEDKTIDDLLIFVAEKAIDGPEGITGYFGPCLGTSSPKLYMRVGLMLFDTGDVQQIIDLNAMDFVATKSMGLSIGFGYAWESYKLVPPSSNPDPKAFYTGKNGIKGLKSIGGKGKPSVVKGDETNSPYVLWDGEAYLNEIMSSRPSIDSKLSKMTISSFKDIGFKVDLSKADDYTISKLSEQSKSSDDISKLKLNLGFVKDVKILENIDSH